MTPAEVEEMMEVAAEKGARRALERIGLHDDDAGRDINDLRTLIDGWRETKRTVTQAVTKWVTMGLLGALALGAAAPAGAQTNQSSGSAWTRPSSFTARCSPAIPIMPTACTGWGSSPISAASLLRPRRCCASSAWSRMYAAMRVPSTASVLRNWPLYVFGLLFFMGVLAAMMPFGGTFYLAQVLAAMEAQAFVEKDLGRLIDVGLSMVPRDCTIARLVTRWPQPSSMEAMAAPLVSVSSVRVSLIVSTKQGTDAGPAARWASTDIT